MIFIRGYLSIVVKRVDLFNKLIAAKQWLHYKEGDHYNYDVGQAVVILRFLYVCIRIANVWRVALYIILTNPTATS